MKIITLLCSFIFLALAEYPPFHYGSYVEKARNFADEARKSLKKFDGMKGFFCLEMGLDQIDSAQLVFNNGNKCFNIHPKSQATSSNSMDDDYIYSAKETACFVDEGKKFYKNIEDAKNEAIAGFTTDCSTFIEYIYGNKSPQSCDDVYLRNVVINMASDCIFMESAIKLMSADHLLINENHPYVNISCIEEDKKKLKSRRRKVFNEFRSCKMDMRNELKRINFSERCFSMEDISKNRENFDSCTRQTANTYLQYIDVTKKKIEKCIRSSIVSTLLQEKGIPNSVTYS